MTNTIILGNGLSALIWAVYHPGSITIGPGTPGGMAKDMKAPFFLHKHPATERLLKKLELSTCTREVKVGYAYAIEGSSEIYDEPPKGFREAYYKYSRCLSDQDSIIPESVMNGGNGHFEAFKIAGPRLMEALMEHISRASSIMITDRIGKICPTGVCTEIYGDTSIWTSIHTNIISTIPATIFYNLVGEGERIIRNEDTLTKIFARSPEYKKDLSDYDFIYFCSPDGERPGLTRITNNKDTMETFFEYTYPGVGKGTERFFLDFLIGKGANISYHPNIAVRKDLKLKGYRGIKFLGRGAQWDHSIKVQDVVMEAQKDAGIS